MMVYNNLLCSTSFKFEAILCEPAKICPVYSLIQSNY